MLAQGSRIGKFHVGAALRGRPFPRAPTQGRPYRKGARSTLTGPGGGVQCLLGVKLDLNQIDAVRVGRTIRSAAPGWTAAPARATRGALREDGRCQPDPSAACWAAGRG